MMNNHSKRLGTAGWTGLAVVVLLAGACGSESGDGAARNKAEWEKKYGTAVSAVSNDLDQARQALSGGQRPLILSACNQLQEDLTRARKALPVPDSAIDTALRQAVDAIEGGIPDCLEGARIANQAHITETAIAEFRDARPKMDEANRAIADWR